MNTNQTTGTECAPWCTNVDARGRTDHTCIGDSSDCIELTAALDYLTWTKTASNRRSASSRPSERQTVDPASQ